MPELAHGNIKPLVYKEDIYREQKEDKWEVLKIISYKDINNSKEILVSKMTETNYKKDRDRR